MTTVLPTTTEPRHTAARIPALLHRIGRLDWTQARSLLTATPNTTCAWADLDGFHIADADHLPADPPHATHLWAWNEDRCLRLRIDGSHALTAALQPLHPGHHHDSADSAGGQGELVHVRLRPGTPWAAHDQQAGPLPAEAHTLTFELLELPGPTPATFVRATARRPPGHPTRTGRPTVTPARPHLRRHDHHDRTVPGHTLPDPPMTPEPPARHAPGHDNRPSPAPVHLVNLTPHPIRLVTDTGTLLTELPPSPTPARRTESTTPQPSLITPENITVPVVRLAFGPVEHLPPPAPGTAYVVSRPVADAHPDRDDLLVPAHLIRDADGNTTACRALARGTATP
ncbi:hypothetical protein [Streptomyces sp. T028]|uniref:hypothetical protein n=1 Tax=Streptomyces sp. T028 TaxID=3394379 RepID=UPI003A8B5B0B